MIPGPTQAAGPIIGALAQLPQSLAVGMNFATAVGGLGLVVLGVAVGLYFAQRRREFEFASLRAMGTEPKQVTRVLLLEQGLMITFAILAGAGIGFGVLRLLMPYVGRSIGSAFPPPILVFDWPALAISLSAIIAASAIGLLAALRALLRSSVTSVLRGEAEWASGGRPDGPADRDRGAAEQRRAAELVPRGARAVPARLQEYRVADTGVVALGGVDFDVGEGEFLAVVGPSGSGKSTILNMIGGLDRATAGTVEVEGRDLGRLDEDELTEYRRDRIGFVWQGTARNLVPYLNVVENVRLPSTASGVKIPAARRTPRELLEVVGLAHRANHRPGQLSGGEQQRVAVAVALSNLPKILLADEPTAELDSESAALVLDAFESVNREFGVTIVMVTHDLLAARRAHRQLRLRDGQLLVEGKPMEPLGTDGGPGCRTRRSTR